MQEKLTKGSIIVDQNGDVVLISRINVQSDEANNLGQIFVYHVGTTLQSNTLPAGSRWAGQIARVVCHASSLLELAEDAGFDLHTPAEKPDSELTQLELLQKQVARLQEQISQSTVVERPRTGIAALQQK